MTKSLQAPFSVDYYQRTDILILLTLRNSSQRLITWMISLSFFSIMSFTVVVIFKMVILNKLLRILNKYSQYSTLGWWVRKPPLVSPPYLALLWFFLPLPFFRSSWYHPLLGISAHHLLGFCCFSAIYVAPVHSIPLTPNFVIRTLIPLTQLISSR